MDTQKLVSCVIYTVGIMFWFVNILSRGYVVFVLIYKLILRKERRAFGEKPFTLMMTREPLLRTKAQMVDMYLGGFEDDILYPYEYRERIRFVKQVTALRWTVVSTLMLVNKYQLDEAARAKNELQANIDLFEANIAKVRRILRERTDGPRVMKIPLVRDLLTFITDRGAPRALQETVRALYDENQKVLQRVDEFHAAVVESAMSQRRKVAPVRRGQDLEKIGSEIQKNLENAKESKKRREK